MDLAPEFVIGTDAEAPVSGGRPGAHAPGHPGAYSPFPTGGVGGVGGGSGPTAAGNGGGLTNWQHQQL